MRELSCKSAYEHEDVIDIDGIITEFSLSEGYTVRPLFVTSFMASLFYPFLP